MNRTARHLFQPLLIGAALLLASVPALAVKPFTANYQASYMGLQGNGQMTLAAAGGDRWKYTLSIQSALAQLSQTTVFEDNGGKWRPLSGNDASSVLIKHSNKTATYDWSKGEARWSGDVKDDRNGPVTLQAGDLDAMLLNLAIVRDVNAGKPLSYRMVDDGRAKPPRSCAAMVTSRRCCGWSTACRCRHASCSARAARTRWTCS